MFLLKRRHHDDMTKDLEKNIQILLKSPEIDDIYTIIIFQVLLHGM